MRPLDGASKPATSRSVVVLPHPEGPSREKNSARAMARSAEATAMNEPKRFDTDSSTMTSAGSSDPLDVSACVVTVAVPTLLDGIARLGRGA